jgi:hypothetical protein
MSAGPVQVVVEIRQGEPEGDEETLRPDVVATLTVDVGLGVAWRIFRDAVERVAPTDIEGSADARS